MTPAVKKHLFSSAILTNRSLVSRTAEAGRPAAKDRLERLQPPIRASMPPNRCDGNCLDIEMKKFASPSMLRTLLMWTILYSFL